MSTIPTAISAYKTVSGRTNLCVANIFIRSFAFQRNCREVGQIHSQFVPEQVDTIEFSKRI